MAITLIYKYYAEYNQEAKKMAEKGVTLGKGNPFLWEYSAQNGIKIIRNFKNIEQIDFFSIDNIDAIVDYVIMTGRVRLSNNVERLKDGSELDGLGKYVFDNIKKDTSHAQSMSQFAAIMVNMGVFKYNGTKKAMEFWVINKNWREAFSNQLVR